MILLSESNTKLGKSNNRSRVVVNFSLPAGKTCPGAKDCASYCFAKRGHFVYPTVKRKHEANLAVSKTEAFITLVNHDLDHVRSKYHRKEIFVRVHVAGDYYNTEYLRKWVAIAAGNPDITFYSYTKSVHLFKQRGIHLPPNLHIRFSLGGKFDKLIDYKNDNMALVMQDKTERESTNNDLLAIWGEQVLELSRR